MRFDGAVEIAAARSWLPDTAHTTADAVAEGLLSADQAAALDLDQATVGQDAGPQFAVWAGRRALADAGCRPSELDLLVHAWTYYQGQDFWSPAHFVADQLGAVNAEAFGIYQMCNGGMTALAVAATRLVADAATRRALVTTGDRFAAPGFDRWRSDYGAVYGDGGTAVLLARAGDSGCLFRLLSVGSGVAAELERTHRDPAGFAPAARAHREQVDVRGAMRLFLADAGLDYFVKAAQRGITDALRGSLADAGLDPADDRIRLLVLPRLGRRVLEQTYLPAVRQILAVDQLELGRQTGHLGAGDGTATLADLAHADERRLAEGEIAIVLSGGAGYSWSSVVVAAGAAASSEMARR